MQVCLPASGAGVLLCTPAQLPSWRTLGVRRRWRTFGWRLKIISDAAARPDQISCYETIDASACPTPHRRLVSSGPSPTRHGQTYLLAHPCALADGEPYGDCITSPAPHYQIWEAWRRGRPKPPLALLAPIILRDQYEHWPRGRIVYEKTPDRFVVYADRQLLTPAWLAQIQAHFHLPPERTIARSALHYSRTRAIGLP